MSAEEKFWQYLFEKHPGLSIDKKFSRLLKAFSDERERELDLAAQHSVHADKKHPASSVPCINGWLEYPDLGLQEPCPICHPEAE